MASTCVFCQLIDGRGHVDWVRRETRASALLPRPQGRLAPGHTLVIPHDHVIGVQEVAPETLQAVILLAQRVARSLDGALGASGVNILNASGPNSDQSVPHLHFHVVPRWSGDGLQTWPEGRSLHQPAARWLEDLRAALDRP